MFFCTRLNRVILSQMQEIAKRELQQEKELEKRRQKESQLQERELARLWKLQTKSNHLHDIKDEIIHERAQEQVS